MSLDPRRWFAVLLLLATSSCSADRPGVTPAAAASAEILVMLPIAPAHFRAGTNYGSGYDEQAGRSARRRVALDLAHTQDLEVISEWPMTSLGVDCFLMRVPSERPIGAVLQALSRDPSVAWAQTLHAYQSLGHNDPLFALQPSASAWHLAEIHAFTTGRNVSVAIVDSGIELTHPDLTGRVSVSKNFVDASTYAAESHGTAVAGIIAANSDNGIGIVGIAPNARLMALRACWEYAGGSATCNSFTLAKALQFALSNDAQVINMSLTGPDDKLLGLLLDAAQSQGVAVVGAFDPAIADGGFPASHTGVIAVAADNAPGNASTVRAPGRDVPSTLPGARWGFVSGSSFAAAHVSGVVALMHELAPSMAPRQTRDMLLSATVTINADQAGDRPNGARTDVYAVIARVANACSCVFLGNSGAETMSRH